MSNSCFADPAWHQQQPVGGKTSPRRQAALHQQKSRKLQRCNRRDNQVGSVLISVGASLLFDRFIHLLFHVRRDEVGTELHRTGDDLKFSPGEQLFIGELLPADATRPPTAIQQLHIVRDADRLGELNPAERALQT